MKNFEKLADGDVFENGLEFVALVEGEDGAHVGKETHLFLNFLMY